jgi:hypothetical protein
VSASDLLAERRSRAQFDIWAISHPDARRQ